MLFLLPLFLAATSTPMISTAGSKVVAESRPGINVSGCEFGKDTNLCPSVSTIDAYADMGFTAVRIPVRSRQLDAALPKLRPAIKEALKRKMLTVVDLHDYLPLDVDARVSAIKRVAQLFGPAVWIDYDNEPKAPTGATGDHWIAAAKATNDIIAGARAAGVTNTLVVEWPGFSGNQRFAGEEKQTDPCGSFVCGLDRVGGLKDSLGKSVLGPHRYFDLDKSGTHQDCAPTAWYWSAYIKDAEARGYKTLIGETAFGSAKGIPASCADPSQAIMGEIAKSKSIVAYMTWGGGASWNNSYPFAVPPTEASKNSVYVRRLIEKR